MWQGAAAEKPDTGGIGKQPNFTLKSYQVLSTANACDIAIKLCGSEVAAASEFPWLLKFGMISESFMEPPVMMAGHDEKGDEGEEVWPAGTLPKDQCAPPPA